MSSSTTRQRKQLGSSNIAIRLGVFNKTIIPLALVGYEIVIARRYQSMKSMIGSASNKSISQLTMF